MIVERFFGICQFFLKLEEKGEIIIIISKVTGDIPFAGSMEIMKQFYMA